MKSRAVSPRGGGAEGAAVTLRQTTLGGPSPNQLVAFVLQLWDFPYLEKRHEPSLLRHFRLKTRRTADSVFFTLDLALASAE